MSCYYAFVPQLVISCVGGGGVFEINNDQLFIPNNGCILATPVEAEPGIPPLSAYLYHRSCSP